MRNHLVCRCHVRNKNTLGQIAVVFAIVLVTMWATTRRTAWRLGYQPQLGHPWFELAVGVPIYRPPAFFWWWYAFDAYAPAMFVEGACVAASGGIISFVVARAMSLWRAREAETAATYGRLARSRRGVSFSVGLGCGQSCALLVWTRLIMPNGRSIILERQPEPTGGYSGLQDDVDHHWARHSRRRCCQTLLSVGAELGSDAGNGDSAVLRRFAVWAGHSLDQAGRQIVRRNLSMQPTLTIRSGCRYG